jgi:hypothetical protein
MNCKNCNNPLEPQARFCVRCGTTVEENTRASGAGQTMPEAPMGTRSREAAAIFPPQQPMVINPQSVSQQPSYTQQAQSPQWSNYQQPTVPHIQQNQPSSLTQTTGFAKNTQQGKPAKRRSLGGCLLSLILVLVVLFAALAGAWFFAIQPYIHAKVLDKLDNTMTNVTDQIDQLPSLPQLTSIPIIKRLPISPPTVVTLPIPDSIAESFVNAQINNAPSGPVQNAVVHINQQGVRLEFNVHLNFLPFDFPSAVSFRPAIDGQGHLVAQNMNIEGIANLVLSPDDLTNLLNKHFATAMTKIQNKYNHTVSDIQFNQGNVAVTFK